MPLMTRDKTGTKQGQNRDSRDKNRDSMDKQGQHRYSQGQNRDSRDKKGRQGQYRDKTGTVMAKSTKKKVLD